MYFCSRTESDVKLTGAILRSLANQGSGTVSGAVVDVSKPDQVEGWIKQITANEKSLDVIVSNVSSLSMANTSESWTLAYQTDIMGTVSLVNACLAHLEQSKGNIITISSVSGRDIDFTATAPYGTFKAALIHYTAQRLYSQRHFFSNFSRVSGGGNPSRRTPETFCFLHYFAKEAMLIRDLEQWLIPLLRKESEQTQSVQGIFILPMESGEV